MIAELAAADHIPLTVVNQDISKETALRRLGLPENFIAYYMTLDIGNHAETLTCYGRSSDILGKEDGIFSFTRGATQGGSESCFIWISFYIILSDMQRDLVQEGVVEFTGSSLRRPTSNSRAAPITHKFLRCDSTVFIDDCQYYSTKKRGTEIRLAICSLFFEFFEIQFNVRKTFVLGNTWYKGSADIFDFEYIDGEVWRPAI